MDDYSFHYKNVILRVCVKITKGKLLIFTLLHEYVHFTIIAENSGYNTISCEYSHYYITYSFIRFNIYIIYIYIYHLVI